MNCAWFSWSLMQLDSFRISTWCCCVYVEHCSDSDSESQMIEQSGLMVTRRFNVLVLSCVLHPKHWTCTLHPDTGHLPHSNYEVGSHRWESFAGLQLCAGISANHRKYQKQICGIRFLKKICCFITRRERSSITLYRLFPAKKKCDDCIVSFKKVRRTQTRNFKGGAGAMTAFRTWILESLLAGEFQTFGDQETGWFMECILSLQPIISGWLLDNGELRYNSPTFSVPLSQLTLFSAY